MTNHNILNWRPMKSAARDGTEVWLLRKDTHDPVKAWWNNDMWQTRDKPMADSEFEGWASLGQTRLSS